MEERAAFARTDHDACFAGGPGRPMMWKRAASIARNTFREAAIVCFTTWSCLPSSSPGGGVHRRNLRRTRKIIVDLGLSAMLLFGVFIAIFVGVGLVYKEIERRDLRDISVAVGALISHREVFGSLSDVAGQRADYGRGRQHSRPGYVSRADPLVQIWPAILSFT
jgi:hypothetical protein